MEFAQLAKPWLNFSAIQLRVSRRWMHVALSILFIYLFIVLAPINGILRDTFLQGLSAFLNEIIMNHHLLVQNVYVIQVSSFLKCQQN